jgi:hypothetical protein
VGSFDDDEGEVLAGVVDEPEEAVGPRQFERFLFNIELLLDLVAHPTKYIPAPHLLSLQQGGWL